MQLVHTVSIGLLQKQALGPKVPLCDFMHKVPARPGQRLVSRRGTVPGRHDRTTSRSPSTLVRAAPVNRHRNRSISTGPESAWGSEAANAAISSASVTRCARPQMRASGSRSALSRGAECSSKLAFRSRSRAFEDAGIMPSIRSPCQNHASIPLRRGVPSALMVPSTQCEWRVSDDSSSAAKAGCAVCSSAQLLTRRRPAALPGPTPGIRRRCLRRVRIPCASVRPRRGSRRTRRCT